MWFVQTATDKEHTRDDNVANDNWCTPEKVLLPIYTFYGANGALNGQPGYVFNPFSSTAVPAIDLDPCSGSGSIVVARKTFTKEDDGLVQDWSKYKRLFINPPYSLPNLDLWSDKCASDGTDPHFSVEILLLVPVYTSSRWYQNNVLATASAILFYNKRISFLLPDGSKSGSPTFHSNLIYWGPRIEEFRRCFSHQGFVITL